MGGADAGSLKEGGLLTHAHYDVKDLMFVKDEGMARMYEVTKFLIKAVYSDVEFPSLFSSLHLGVE